jgi:benzoate-CoA ligase family protein
MKQMNSANVLYQHIEAGRGNKRALLLGKAGEVSWTYGELVNVASRTGNALKQLGVEPENRVALILLDGAEFVASFYGAIAIGAVPVPLNTSLASSDYEVLLQHSRAKVAIISAALAYLIEPIRAQCPELRHVVLGGGLASSVTISWRQWIDRAQEELVPTDVSPDEPAFWLYSSGSTGLPKGVVHLHRAVPYMCRYYAEQVLGLNESDVCFSAAKFFHGWGICSGMFFPLFFGATTVIWYEQPLAEVLFELIDRFHPTVFFATPVHFAGMLDWSETENKYDLSSLRFCVSAGEPLPRPILERWRSRFGLEILDAIGSSEVLSPFISNRPGHSRPGSTGELVPGFRAKIVNETGEPVVAGEVGDLWVSGETSAIGYWQDRARTQATMRGEWVVTGDKYRCDKDNYFWYEGRSDDMLKINGIWVSPIRVEDALNRHAAVAECAVVGIRGENEMLQINAFVILRPKTEPTAELVGELRSLVRQTFPRLYPPIFQFVTSLPKTVTGKIQRFRLRTG